VVLKRNEIRFATGNLSRLAVAIMFGWTTIVHPVLAQPASDTPQQVAPPVGTAPTDASGQPSAETYSLTELEYLLGPIALYPDPLLALILPASSFPEQIKEAANWLASNPQAVQRSDFAEVDAKPWDSSVRALARFPDVIKMLSEHLDWTESLGWAYSVQPDDVTNVTQMLRAKAESAGNLKSTPQQQVTRRQEGGQTVIYIAPVDPERIYVPVYDPSLVFDSVVTGALVFGTAVLVGSAWNNRWGWNNRNWNQVWISGPIVRPRSPRPPGAWRPDRPGRPGVRPDRPGVRPDRPGVRPDRPGMRPDRPGARPDRPSVRPDRPTSRPDSRPSRPANRPNRPQRPEAGGGRQPGASSRPGNAQRLQHARPQQQRARPQQGARTQQQRSRPQQSARPLPQRARSQQSARPQQQRARPQQRGRRGQ